LEERRAARRYKLALQVEIRLESNLKEFEPILGRTRDISTHGFYFEVGQRLSVGMKIGFSTMPRWESTQATHAFISGQASYRIEPAGNAFIVIDPWGERLVDVFPTEEAARLDIERCQREDAIYETATQLVDIAIEAHAQKFGIDRETAEYWLRSAMGG
jgi:hypothetical protein